VTAHGEQQSPTSGDQPRAQSRAYGDEVNTLVELYGKHERRIYRYCLALLRNPDDAEDATQETFTRAAPFLPNLAGDLSAYLTTVARNICCDVVRARARRPVPLDKVALPDRTVGPERQSVDWDVVRRMWRQLTPSERLLFAYTFAGYRYEEIATRTGMSRPSVSVGLTRARRRLRDLATAIGALGLLPLGLRRLLERISRRTNAALATGQQALLVVAEQAGAVTAALLAGLVGLVAGGPAVVAAPAMTVAAYQVQGTAPSTAPAVTTATAAAPRGEAPGHTGGGARPPARPPQPFAPSVDRAAAVLPGGAATPDDTSASSVTPSPRFSQDGIAFMVGDVQRGCAGATSCPAAFRTDDAAGSWTRVWPATFPGGSLLLSPRFPADPAVFVLSPRAGLIVAPKGDGVFTTVVPSASAAAVAPDSAPDHARVVAVTNGVLVGYSVGDAAPTPGPALPAGMTATGLVFTAPGQVLVAGWQETATPAAGLVQQATLVSCSLSLVCGTLHPLPGFTSVRLVSTGAFGSPLLAYSSAGALLSTDGGASFHPLLTPPGGQVLEAAGMGALGTATRVVFSFSDAATERRTTVSYSDDLGATLTGVTGDLQSAGYAVAARVLDSGNLLLGLSADPRLHFSLLESTGTGHWASPHAF
jgi:RNA polymerase sigma-70 factor (ECF subfamily)